ncbi:hypothetical protein HY008_01865 [Candidatus Woesebacteria bacterium]|nr:hypothetical protein [Candidatus Woesebacteria bacterium]
MSLQILEGKVKEGDRVVVEVENNKVIISTK